MRKQLDSELVTILKWHTQKDQKRVTEAISPIIMTVYTVNPPKKAKRRKYKD